MPTERKYVLTILQQIALLQSAGKTKDINICKYGSSMDTTRHGNVACVTSLLQLDLFANLLYRYKLSVNLKVFW